MAQLTITTTAQQDARISPAFGDVLQLGRDATLAEVKAYLVNQIRNIVLRYEERTLPPLDPT